METETSFSQLAPPVFDGENYQLWAVRMETYLEALDLWEAVEEDYDVLPLPNNPTVAQIKSHKEKKTRKSKAKATLFAGDERIRGMKVLNLIREFELQKMKESETVKEYSDRLLGIVNKAQEQRRLMRQDGMVEGALAANHRTQSKGNNAKKNYPPCQHCGKKGHPPFKCWKRPDAKCKICNQLGHEAIDLRTEKATELFTCRPFWPRNYTSLTLSEIAVDPRNPYFFAVAGADEFARIFDMRKYSWDGSADFGQPVDYFCPSHLVGIQDVGITGLSISDRSELLVSYFEEVIYLLTKDMGLGPDPSPISPSLVYDSYEGEMDLDDRSDASPPLDAGLNFGPPFYMGHKYGEELNGVTFFGPRCEYIAGGSDCGRIYIWNKKSREVVRVMEADRQCVSYVVSHPHTTVLASCGMEPDTKIWTPKALDRAILPTDVEKEFAFASDRRTTD
ncbi:hypothetical protein A4A49_07833 [Nicotiana attenuata]|uniref:DUF4219 domain-containing protein n=1 Tax=Nicotiana attenuata TaxID=49451 RepID=A0A314KTE9_NICAT|nr:hypothetical protein A4A49_07833 [Nicotiana attenuata]